MNPRLAAARGRPKCTIMPSPSLLDRLLRMGLTAVHHGMKTWWMVRRPRTFGAHALALTPEGRIILVKLRYASGWRLPGGGMREGEDPAQAVIRELREEIGLKSYGRVRPACALEEITSFKRDLASMLIVEDVLYDPPRFSWEIERVAEAPLDQLPTGLSPRTRKWLDAIRPSL